MVCACTDNAPKAQEIERSPVVTRNQQSSEFHSTNLSEWRTLEETIVDGRVVESHQKIETIIYIYLYRPGKGEGGGGMAEALTNDNKDAEAKTNPGLEQKDELDLKEGAELAPGVRAVTIEVDEMSTLLDALTQKEASAEGIGFAPRQTVVVVADADQIENITQEVATRVKQGLRTEIDAIATKLDTGLLQDLAERESEELAELNSNRETQEIAEFRNEIARYEAELAEKVENNAVAVEVVNGLTHSEALETAIASDWQSLAAGRSEWIYIPEVALTDTIAAEYEVRLAQGVNEAALGIYEATDLSSSTFESLTAESLSVEREARSSESAFVRENRNAEFLVDRFGEREALELTLTDLEVAASEETELEAVAA